MIRKSFLIMLFTFFMSITFPANSDFYDLIFESIDGNTIPLKEFKNKPIIVVNSASFCGFTYQYEQLENLYQKYKKKGLVIIAIPSNDFGGQELASEAEVKQFCEVNFNIDFPLTAITSVKGGTAHPFYQWAGQEAGILARPKWNFHKYLIDRNGQLAASFSSVTLPTSDKIITAIETALTR